MNDGRRSSGKVVLWVMIGAVFAGSIAAAVMVERDAPAKGPFPADGELASPAAEERFTGEGFAAEVPADWRIERAASDSVAIYDRDPSMPEATSTACKIEISAFPFSSLDDEGAWIAARIGADPSVKVVEESSEDIAVSGGAGVRWNGTIDGVPATFVYAFGADHAYEIAPSVVGAGAAGDAAGGGNTACNDVLDAFVAQFSMQ